MTADGMYGTQEVIQISRSSGDFDLLTWSIERSVRLAGSEVEQNELSDWSAKAGSQGVSAVLDSTAASWVRRSPIKPHA